MRFDWNDYSGESGTEEVPLLLSDKSQMLILAAMQSLDSRSNWLDVDDATWDEIHAAIGEAYEEITEQVVNVSDNTPVGSIMWFPGLSSDIPDKWLKCDGSSLLRTAYPDLFLILRSVYPFTSTHFELPDLSAKFLYGSNLDAQVGTTGGAETHTLTLAEMPAHTHNVPARANAGSSAAAALASAAANTNVATDSKGSGSAHNNMPPYVRGYWMIKALP